MKPADNLRFALRDRINGVDVGPKAVPLSLLGEFQKEVSDFLQGSTREVNPAEVLVSIEEGSLVVVAEGLLAASMLWADMERLAAPDSLNAIDPRRAAVIERWQAQARNNPHRVCALEDTARRPLTIINAQSDFKQSIDIWVTVEKYLHGKIVDWGGKTKANVHLVLENGKSLTVSTTQQLLAQESENRLYRPALLHVTAEENLRTGELRNLNLRSFEVHHPAYDEDEFQQMVRKGTAAWSDVPDATRWVESLRGDDS